MTRYVSLEQALELSAIACEGPAEVRDLGLLDSAVHRPQTSVFGQDAYPDLFTKAAALLQSLAVNHPFVDGNKRTAWLVTTVFLRKNDIRLTPDEDEAFKLVVGVAAGVVDDLEEIARKLRSFTA